MVGGFVQQQQIWFVDQRAGQGHARVPPDRPAICARGRPSFSSTARTREGRCQSSCSPSVLQTTSNTVAFSSNSGSCSTVVTRRRAASDVAIVGQGPAIEQPEQRGLAGAVAADQADAFAGLDGEVGMVQQRVMAVGQLDVCQGGLRGPCRNRVCGVDAGISAYCRRKPRPLPHGDGVAGVLEYAAQGGLDDRGGCESIEEGPDSTGQGSG